MHASYQKGALQFLIINYSSYCTPATELLEMSADLEFIVFREISSSIIKFFHASIAQLDLALSLPLYYCCHKLIFHSTSWSATKCDDTKH